MSSQIMAIQRAAAAAASPLLRRPHPSSVPLLSSLSQKFDLQRQRCKIQCQSDFYRHESGTAAAASSPRLRPKLTYEWVVDGKVLPPSSDRAPKAAVEKGVVVFLHGLLGNAKNLRTPAKKLTERLPHLSALLVNLRGHGSSSVTCPADFPPPHTFDACVADVFDTLSPLGLTGGRSPVGVCGHSFGGRLALQYTHALCMAASSSNSAQGNEVGRISDDGDDVIRPPLETWVLDSVPGSAHGSVRDVIRAVSSVPMPVPSRKHLMDTMMNEHGVTREIAAWMTTNLRGNAKDGFEWVFDMAVAEDVLGEFHKQDFVGMLRHICDSPVHSKIQIVMAGKNDAWTEEVVRSLKSIEANDGGSGGENHSFAMHTLPKAGHWVHVDDLDGLMTLMEKALR